MENAKVLTGHFAFSICHFSFSILCPNTVTNFGAVTLIHNPRLKLNLN